MIVTYISATISKNIHQLKGDHYMSNSTEKQSLPKRMKAFCLRHFKILWIIFGDPFVDLDDKS